MKGRLKSFSDGLLVSDISEVETFSKPSSVGWVETQHFLKLNGFVGFSTQATKLLMLF